MNNLADLLAADADSATVTAIWADVGTGLSPAARAELLSYRSAWRHQRGETATAVADLSAAAQLIDLDAPPDEPSSLARARQHLRTRLAEFDSSELTTSAFPSWATTAIPDTAIDLANAWITADWPRRKQILADQDLPADWRVIRALAAVYCDRPALQQWLDILSDIDSRGQDAVFAAIDAADRTATLLRDWISTPSWNASQAFLAAHPELHAPEAVTALEQWSGDDVARQHLAILRLTEHLPAGDVFDAILDATDTRSLLFRAARTGDAQLVVEVWYATPHLAADAFAGPLAVALVAALAADADNAGDEIDEAARAAADSATSDLRRETLDLLQALVTTRDDRADQVSLITRAFARPAADAAV